MPKILVTGGAGYIGSITTHHLLRRGFDVIVVDDLSRGHRKNNAPERLHVLRLQETGALAKLLDGVDAVVHGSFHGLDEAGRKVHVILPPFEMNIPRPHAA